MVESSVCPVLDFDVVPLVSLGYDERKICFVIDFDEFCW